MLLLLRCCSRNMYVQYCMYVQAARACKIEVMYTVIQSVTADGRERSLDYKISGFHVPPGCWDAKVLYTCIFTYTYYLQYTYIYTFYT